MFRKCCRLSTATTPPQPIAIDKSISSATSHIIPTFPSSSVSQDRLFITRPSPHEFLFLMPSASAQLCRTCHGFNRIFDTVGGYGWPFGEFNQEDMTKFAQSRGCRGCNILHSAISCFPEYFNEASHITVKMNPWNGDEKFFYTLGVKKKRGVPITIFDVFKRAGT